MGPLISCVLPTANRPAFLRQAIDLFLRQTYPHRELIIVDDGKAPSWDAVHRSDQITYIRLQEHTPLGTKLNLAIARARGKVIQKWDDDDYYHPAFLHTNVAQLLGQGNEQSVVCHDRFLVLLAATGELKVTGSGWCAGSTLCFFRALWERGGFRAIHRAVDWAFLEDHKPIRCKVSDPELHIVVRHGNHTWTRLGKQEVEAYFRTLPGYHRALEDLLNAEDVRFYRSLAARLPSGRTGGAADV